MAGGRVPLVPYYPNKATGSKDYQWMDIYNALGRERYNLSFFLFPSFWHFYNAGGASIGVFLCC